MKKPMYKTNIFVNTDRTFFERLLHQIGFVTKESKIPHMKKRQALKQCVSYTAPTEKESVDKALEAFANKGKKASDLFHMETIRI